MFLFSSQNQEAPNLLYNEHIQIQLATINLEVTKGSYVLTEIWLNICDMILFCNAKWEIGELGKILPSLGEINNEVYSPLYGLVP